MSLAKDPLLAQVEGEKTGGEDSQVGRVDLVLGEEAFSCPSPD